MNAFFCSIEQRDHMEWRGKPIAITNGKQGTCLITCSYEARAYGVKTDMRLREARELCPDLIQVPSNPKRYAEVSQCIMETLQTITPDVEIFSVDEAYLDVTHCQQLFGAPETIGRLVKQKVLDVSGLVSSIGVSGDKTTAKFAAKLQKPNGFQVIPPWEAKARLANVPVTELCGIATGVGNYLARYGVYSCGDIEKLPISILGKRFGNLGRRMWYMCMGADPDPVHTKIADPKSMGHGKVMPPNTTDEYVVLVYLMHMCEKLAARLRRHHMQAQQFFIGVRSRRFGWLGDKAKLIAPTNDGRAIYKLGKNILKQWWIGEPVEQIQVTVLDLDSIYIQQDLFLTPYEKTTKLHQVVDEINSRYGEFTIAPAWKPYGHRQTI